MHSIKKTDFLADVSYSYWQLLGGYNRTIIADDAVPGRYHIFTTYVAKPEDGHNYSIVDDGLVTVSAGFGIDPEMLVQGAAELVGFYERVRNLPFFDPKNCPFIECQLVGGAHQFLQYHVGRNFHPASFELTRDPHDDEVEVFFARGATPPEGLGLQAAFYYPYGEEVLEDKEDASFDYHYNHVFSEIMSRRRQAQFVDNKYSHQDMAQSFWSNHLQKSLLFKPKISLAGNMKQNRPHDVESFFKKTEHDRRPARFSTYVVSDGRRAFMRKFG